MVTPARSLILCALLPLAACSPTPGELKADAAESLAANRFAQARMELLAALEEQPGDAQALQMLATAQVMLGDGEGAAATLARLGNAASEPLALLRGEAELLRGRPSTALAAVQAFNSADAFRLRGLAHLAAGRPAEAWQQLEAGLAAPGPKARLQAERALMLLRGGDRTGAAEAAAAALAEAPEGLDPLLAAGRVAAARGDLAAALAHYEKASARFPENRAALSGRIATLGDLARTAEMEPLLRQLAGAAPGDPAVAYLQARLAASRGEWRQVRATLQPVEGQMADMPEAALLYAQALGALGLHEQASGHARKVLSRWPGHPLALKLLAESQLGTGDAAGALATLAPLVARPEADQAILQLAARAAQAAGSADAPALARRASSPNAAALAAELATADAALRREDWQAAAVAYRRLMDLTDGTSPIVLNNLAYAEGRLGNVEQGLGYALEALERAPANPQVMDTAGWLLVRSGKDKARGLALLRDAARRAPGNAAIARHLAEAGA